ncbi:MAG TPA: SdpI family protein [Acidobacteriaceae bacterium]
MGLARALRGAGRPHGARQGQAQFSYGVRTPKTLSSEELWYRANRSAGYAMILGVGASLVTWLVLALLPLSARLRCAADLMGMALFVVAALLIGSARAGAF